MRPRLDAPAPSTIFIAALLSETNTFSPLATGWAAFEEQGIFRGNATLVRPPLYEALPLAAWCDLAAADGRSVVEGLCTLAQPAGRVVRVVYESLRDEILGQIRAALPVDMILLSLHGAMVAAGYEDCEGDLMSRARAIVGPDVFIGALLDLHCHATNAMFKSADAIVAYKHYPHTDIAARAADLYGIGCAAGRQEIKPVTRVFDCRMIGMWRTIDKPVAKFVRRMMAVEHEPGVLSVSLGHGFPYGDVVDTGAKLWVITDADSAQAERLASQLGTEFFALRDVMQTSLMGVDGALDEAMRSTERPFILADIADNAGGGAPGDSTFILEALLERGIEGAVAGCFYDPIAAGIAAESGVGSTLDLRIGGKLGPSSGVPIDLRVEVRNVVEDHSQAALGGRTPLGRCAWVRAAGIDIVLASVRSQTFSTEAYTGMGITLTDKRIIVVKSSEHFRASFSEISAQIVYVSTPGALTQDFASIPYVNRSLNYWPRLDDPFATAP